MMPPEAKSLRVKLTGQPIAIAECCRAAMCQLHKAHLEREIKR